MLRQFKLHSLMEVAPDTTVFSPSRHYIAIVGVGEGPGGLNIYDDQGNLVSTFNSSEITGDPFHIVSKVFFISETKIFCNGFIYDMNTKKLKPALQFHGIQLKCVAGMPGRSEYVYFLSDKGLELWNIATNRMLERQAGIKEADDLYFSPDNSVMGVLHGDSLDFWNFDPKTLLPSK